MLHSLPNKMLSHIHTHSSWHAVFLLLRHAATGGSIKQNKMKKKQQQQQQNVHCFTFPFESNFAVELFFVSICYSYFPSPYALSTIYEVILACHAIIICHFNFIFYFFFSRPISAQWHEQTMLFRFIYWKISTFYILLKWSNGTMEHGRRLISFYF